ncbi:MAG: hypothetical protein FWD71_10975 [Oscillospiraceae bacterium]|nr:hypothetical protein [Oscillospiraceae bacterium]
MISDTSNSNDTSDTLADTQNSQATESVQSVAERVEVLDPKTVFPDIPARFSTIPFLSTLQMTDTLKQNIKNLDSFATKDFGGNWFNILTTNAGLFTPSYGGGALSDARYYRTAIVQKACGVQLAVTPYSKDLIADYIEQEINAGDYFADIICVPLDVQSALMQKGLLVDMKKIPFINLNADYYNQSAVQSFNVNSNIYGLVSDAAFDPSNIYAMFYNKSLIKQYNLNSPADLYNNGKWTYDGMFEISKSLAAAVANLNEPGVSNSSYSIGFNKDDSDIINGLFISSGNKYFTQPNGGSPALNFDNDTTQKLIDAMANIFAPSYSSGMSNYLDADENNQKSAFENGEVLFSIAKLDIMPDITNSNFDWGILPMPSFDGTNANTDGNILSFTDSGAMCISVLKGSKSTETSGIVTEALSMSSYKFLKEMYIRDQMLYTLRDVDSVKFLNDIVNGATFSQYNAFSTVDTIYNATVGVLKNAANKNGDFADLYASAKQNIDDFFQTSTIFAGN